MQTHRRLRDRLATLRDEIAEGIDSTAPHSVSDDLLTHCLGFCGAVHTHHNGEDTQLLPALREAQPDLAPVIDNLIEDHEMISGILERLDGLLRDGAPRESRKSQADWLVGELDGLSAILDSHFSYEERRVAAALDELGGGDWVRHVFEPEAG